MRKDPISNLKDRIKRLEREMALLVNKVEKMNKLYEALTEYFKYISIEVRK